MEPTKKKNPFLYLRALITPNRHPHEPLNTKSRKGDSCKPLPELYRLCNGRRCKRDVLWRAESSSKFDLFCVAGDLWICGLEDCGFRIMVIAVTLVARFI